MSEKEIILRYGFNPHQKHARIYVKKGTLPFRVLNGAPGYINMLDALNSWQLVKELKQALKLPVAASFKHVSPAGVAVGISLSDALKKAYFVDDMEQSPLMVAYARARGADRVSSYGDFAAFSDTIDVATAKLINREVSDGVIAPGYEKGALEILKAKKGGKYLIIEIDTDYTPEETETREVFGIRFEQKRNNAVVTAEMLKNTVTKKKDFPAGAVRDLIVTTAAIKYTQSNTIGFGVEGQAIGIGAGQQSRIHCTRLAAEKADRWFLRQHPTVLSIKFKQGVARAEKNNAIDLYLQERLNSFEKENLKAAMEKVPPQLTYDQKREWLGKLKGVSLSSDGMIPFRDTIDRAYESGVAYVLQPGGSIRDADVIKACDAYGMVMAFSGVRLFHH
ncbi:MAG: 5-aminoimidazole-4-carboxamide ribonucleotide transformylase [Chloroflexi bacterium RBG_13_51_52]|nr:MAG: 5-aminoimidazole-4-carboxamide ribonucleotide transformylase [Chloroflexi bacterium RBG_13_51_52]